MRAWIVMLFLLLPSVSAAVLNASTSVSISIADGNGLFSYEGGSYSFNASENVSQAFILNASYAVSDPVNLSLNLTSGEKRNLSGSFDVLNLSCASSNVTVCSNYTVVPVNGTCNISKTVSPGDKYVQNDSACNVAVTCERTAQSCSNDTFEVSRTVLVQKEENTLRITVGNETKTIDLNLTNASYSTTLNVACPVMPLDESDDLTARQTYDYCVGMFPQVNDWLNLTLNRCFNNFDAYRDFVKAKQDADIVANQALSDCRANEGKLEGTMTSLQAENDGLKNQLLQRDQDQDMLVIWIAVLTIVCLGLIVACGFLFNYAQRGD